MGKVKDWLKESHRWQHFVGGIGVGLLSNDWYCAALAGCGIAGALEFKDYQWGGKPSVIDFALTLNGVIVGFSIRLCSGL